MLLLFLFEYKYYEIFSYIKENLFNKFLNKHIKKSTKTFYLLLFARKT